MAESTACVVTQCERDVLARGMCGLHYGRWMKTGSTDAPAARGEQRPCREPACGREAVVRGLCRSHYQTWRKRGRGVGPEGDTCTVEGCHKVARVGSVCREHAPAGAGTALPGEPVCNVPGCADRVLAVGLCGAHYRRPGDHRPVGDTGRPVIVGRWDHDNYGVGWIPGRDRTRTRDGDQCRRCGRTAEDVGSPLHVAHLVPNSAGGKVWQRLSNLPANLVQLCEPCHAAFDGAPETRWDYDAADRRTWPAWTAQSPADVREMRRQTMLLTRGLDAEAPVPARASTVRGWGNANGWSVGARGPLPDGLEAAYREALRSEGATDPEVRP